VSMFSVLKNPNAYYKINHENPKFREKALYPSYSIYTTAKNVAIQSFVKIN